MRAPVRFPVELPAAATSCAMCLDIRLFCGRFASFSKTVVGATPLPRVRIPPPPLEAGKARFCRAFA
jgi:hypothetical protein